MIEELAAHILNVDADEEWDELDGLLYDEFNITLEDFEKLIKKLFEPPRVFRRQFILSQATLADSSSWR